MLWQDAMRACSIILLGALIGGPAAAAEQSVAVPFAVGDTVPAGAALEDVCCGRAASAFSGARVPSYQFGYGTTTVWFKARLPDEWRSRQILEITPRTVDQIDLYMRTADGDVVEYSGGDLQTLSRPIPGPAVAFPVESGAARDIFVKVTQSTPVGISMRLWSPGAFAENQYQDAQFENLFYGFITAIVLYNLFIFLFVRDITYLFNVVFVASSLVLYLYLRGVGVTHVWSSWPHLSNIILNITVATMGTSGLGLVYSFFRAGKTAPWFARANIPLFAICALSIPANLVAPYWTIQIAVIGCAAAIVLLQLVLVIARLHQGDRSARALMFPFAAICVGMTAAAAHAFGVLQFGYLGGRILELTLIAEALLFSLALSYRIRVTEAGMLKASEALVSLQRDVTRRLLSAQDAERKRIATDLHDTVGQSMLAVANRLTSLSKSAALPAGAAEEVRQTADYAKETVADVRRISHDLHPPMIDRLGWSTALATVLDRFADAVDIDVASKVDVADGALDLDAKTHLLRIVQEAMNNIARHASASACEVDARIEDGHLKLRVADDGIGMSDPERARRQSDAIGFTSIDERVRLLGGTWRVSSRPGEGTTILIDVPIAGSVQGIG